MLCSTYHAKSYPLSEINRKNSAERIYIPKYFPTARIFWKVDMNAYRNYHISLENISTLILRGKFVYFIIKCIIILGCLNI